MEKTRIGKRRCNRENDSTYGGGANRTDAGMDTRYTRAREKDETKNRNICKTAGKRRTERASSDRPGGPAAVEEEEGKRRDRDECAPAIESVEGR